MVDNGSFRTTSYLQEVIAIPSEGGNALLSNSKKSGSVPRRNIDPSTDLKKLDICFGGFSPTLMGDADAAREKFDAFEARRTEAARLQKEAADLDRAATSDVRALTTDGGIEWKYVIVQDDKIRIESCTIPEEPGVTELRIPESIEDLPVVSLANEACSKLMTVESITLPDTIIAVGFSAFRGCESLKSITFSANLSKFDSGWFRGCNKVESISMPGAMEKMTSAVFDIKSLKHLKLGANTSEVMPGAFGNSNLESIEISPENQFLFTDGIAVYSKDPCVLVALAVPVESFSVVPECVAIGRKGLSALTCVQEVKLPETLEIVGDFAFTRTSIERFDAPSSLRAIGERAFYACEKLKYVQLDNALISIGPNAFSETSIRELFIPGSVEMLGNPLAASTALTYSGPDATLRVDASDDAKLMLDEHGGLYKRMPDGLHLMRMLEPDITEYEVLPGTVSIDDEAFAKHAIIASVSLPDSTTHIGKGAFKNCKTLTDVSFGYQLQSIDDEAFLGTNIRSIVIPESLVRIGAIALITSGAYHGTEEPSLTEIVVSPSNSRFRMQDSLLIEKLDSGIERVIVCTGENPDLTIPASVSAIAPYALNGLRRLKHLSLHDGITMIETRGLAFDCLLESIHIDLGEPIEGHTSFDLDIPDTTRAAQQIGHAFGSPNFVNVEAIFDHYDNSIVNANGFDAKTDKVLEPYEQVRRLVERLKDPIFMSPYNHNLAEKALSVHLDEYMTEIAKHDDKPLVDALIDMGYINSDNIAQAIEAVSRVQDASVTNHLLDAKHRFDGGGVDFDSMFEL